MKRAPRSSSSSSSSDQFRSDQIRSDDEEEEEERLYGLLDQLGYAPEPWCRHFESQDELVTLMGRPPLLIALPDALDLVATHGIEAVEGALIRTMAHNRNGQVRKPGGLFVATLRGKRDLRPWDARQVTTFITAERRQAIARAERSDNVTVKNTVARLLALQQRPENVTPLRGARP